ncbi:MAG: molybdopterin dehydrogenase FAD-binding protein [Marmoricola sp.]|nr:molybdopterin dehydrogenase FAD-binding protein [Marmoricola sp.]
MDLNTVTSLRPARSRDDLRLAPGEAFLGGGSWLFSEPQPALTGLVDLTTLGWEPWAETPSGLSVAATCTVAELVEHAAASSNPSAAVFGASAEALLMSFKIWGTATVGGNLCLALPAGAMISLMAGLGAEVVVWTPDGGERREPVAAFVTGAGTTTLLPGEVLRSIEVPVATLASRAVLRTAALTTLGRSSAVVLGRTDGDSTVLTVTASTPRPYVLELGAVPGRDEVVGAVDAINDWYDDAHGAPDWRAGVTRELALDVCAELHR